MSAAPLLLLGLGLAAATLLGTRLLAGGRGGRLSTRLATVARPYARARPLGEAARRRPPVTLPPAVSRGLSLAFGYEVARTDQYPAPPLVIAIGALLPALLLALYAASLFGEAMRGLVVALWPLLSRLAFGKLHARRAAKLYLQLPDTLAMVVRAVRAGIPVVEALRTVGREVADPTGLEFRRISDQLAIGIALETALRGLAARSGLAEYAFFAVALTLQNAAGGNLTDTLENLADVVRKRVAARQRGAALASQARASAYILSAVPVVTVGALMLINPGYIMMLFDDPRGNTVVGLAIGSLAIGMGMMRFMINRSLS